MQDIGYRPLSGGDDPDPTQALPHAERTGEGKGLDATGVYTAFGNVADGVEEDASAAATASAAEEGCLCSLDPPCASGGSCTAPSVCFNLCAPAVKMSVREALLLSPYDKWRLYGRFPWKLFFHLFNFLRAHFLRSRFFRVMVFLKVLTSERNTKTQNYHFFEHLIPCLFVLYPPTLRFQLICLHSR